MWSPVVLWDAGSSLRRFQIPCLPRRKTDAKSAAEAVPVGTGGNIQVPLKRATERFKRAEATFCGDLLDSRRRFFEPAPSGFEPDLLHILRRCQLGFPLEHAGEVPRTHSGALGQGLDTEILFQMILHPRLEFPQRLALGCLQLEMGAELALRSRPA